MPDYTSSANMGLPIPIVGTTAGPDYASDLNSCLTLIDQHDHSSGYGVAITPTGLNINAALPFGNNNLTGVRSVRFQTQTTPIALAADLGCLYESGVDLYYNDGSGNQVRITQSGGVAGSPGSIASLASPASATYVAGSGTFVWQSAANTPAIMDGASVIIRNPTAAANGVTLAAANALAANYTLTFPAALPAATNFVAVSSTGNISAYAPVSLGLTAANIANATITTTQISATAAIIGTQLSSSAAILGSQLSASANIVGTQLTSGTITATQLASNAVTTAKILNSNVTAAKIEDSVNLPGAGVKVNSKYAVVSNTNASSGLAIIRGVVLSGGAIAYGEGFTAADAGNDFLITFSTAFASPPAVAVTAYSENPADAVCVRPSQLGTGSCRIYGTDSCGISFVIVGPKS